MYGIGDEVDLSFLVGARLQQVTVGEFQAQLRFDQDVTISIETAFGITLDGSVFTVEPLLDADQSTLQLIGKAIQSERHTPDGSLTIEFEDGTLIELRDTSTEYESYQITHGASALVV